MAITVTERDGAVVLVEKMEWRRREGHKCFTTLYTPDTSAPRWTGQRAVRIALARGYAWQRLIDEGRYPSITALANYLEEDVSYVSRLMGLMLLAPDIIDALLDGREPDGTSLEKLIKAQPMAWSEQRKALGFIKPPVEANPDADAAIRRLVADPAPELEVEHEQ